MPGKKRLVNRALLVGVSAIALAGCSGGEGDNTAGEQTDPAVSRIITAIVADMADIPGGAFDMGDSSGTGDADERPAHRVTVGAFRLARHELSFAEWDACVADGRCTHKPADQKWGRGTRPVINVSWEDGKTFVAWLNGRTDGGFRLPSEAEWEYAARAGTTSEYPWGDTANHDHANFGTEVCCDGWVEGLDQWEFTAPVGSFPPNAFGLYDMHGNVWEWTEDCWHDDYTGAPTDGSAWTVGGNCKLRVARGGAWFTQPDSMRSANRYGPTSPTRFYYTGLRLARSR